MIIKCGKWYLRWWCKIFQHHKDFYCPYEEWDWKCNICGEHNKDFGV